MRTVLFAIVALVSIFQANAMDENTLPCLGIESFIFELTVLNVHIGELDPIHYTLTLENTSREDHPIKEPWNRFIKPQLEMRHEGDSSWIQLENSALEPFAILRPPVRGYIHTTVSVLPSMARLDKSFLWSPFFQFSRLSDYSKSEIFYLRAVTYPCEKEPLISNEVQITFKDDEIESESKAIAWLKTKKIPGFFYEITVTGSSLWGFYAFEDKNTKANCEEFIEKFPASRYTDWVKLHLALFYYSGLADWKDNWHYPNYDKATEILETIGDSSEEFVQQTRMTLVKQINYAPFKE